jgi:hypothetical protein
MTNSTESEWEIGVRVVDDHNEWEHFHPTAETESEAREKALEEASSGLNSIGSLEGSLEVYMVAGPF